VRTRARQLGVTATAVSVVALSLTLLTLTSASSANAPGISSNEVKLGAIVTTSGYAAADFGAYLYGVNAYLYYVDHTLHGVDGRQLVMADALNDDSYSNIDESDAETLVTSDQVFGIVGVSTAFFGAANYLKTSGVPTFGYATSSQWKGPKNFFADYGSVIDYATSVPEFGYVAKKLNATKVAVLAYNYSSSDAECQPAVSDLKKDYGVNVAYSNLSEPLLGANFTDDVENMSRDHVDLVISCMQASDDVALTRLMQEYGMSSVPQIWLDGYDRSTLAAYAPYMTHTYLMLQHVPFEDYANYPSVFPGLGLYFTQMRDYLMATYPSTYSSYLSYQYDDVALMGWESANLFTVGLRAAGQNPTRAAVINDINKITDDFGGPKNEGVTDPTNWKVAHTKDTSPSCVTFVTTKGTSDPATASFSVAFNHGSDPWICFPLTGKINLSKPVAPPAGTPGG
jgi:branched-chain amino acid transport system substrate-binding protein